MKDSHVLHTEAGAPSASAMETAALQWHSLFAFTSMFVHSCTQVRAQDLAKRVTAAMQDSHTKSVAVSHMSECVRFYLLANIRFLCSSTNTPLVMPYLCVKSRYYSDRHGITKGVLVVVNTPLHPSH